MPQHLTPRRRNIAAAAVTAALLGAFGVGAYAVSQGDFSFDPGAYLSDLGANEGDGDKGFRSNRTDTDAEANRHKDGTESDERSADEQQAQDDASTSDDGKRTGEDAFTAANLQTASGSTAYNVTGKDDGTGVTVNNGDSSSDKDNQPNGDGNTGGSGDNNATGPVVNPDGNGTGGGDGGGTGGDGKTEDQGSGEKPGGGDNGNGGSNNGGGSGSDPTPAPTPTPNPTPSFNPTDNSYKVLPKDPTPDIKNDNFGLNGNYTESASSNPVGPKTHYEITVAYGLSSSLLYQDQVLDAWTIYCALSTSITYVDEDNPFNSLMWDLNCKKSDFESGDYPYFRIDDWYYTEDGAEVHTPSRCPGATLTVVYSYRFSKNDAWQAGNTLDVVPSKSCVFVVGNEKGDGTRDVLYQSASESINLLGVSAISKFFQNAGYLRDDNTIDHLLLGWQEAGQPVDYFYALTPGRHVIEPGEVVELQEGYEAKLQLYNMTDDLQVTDDIYATSCYLQTLYAVDDTVVAEDGTLVVPEGIQAIDEARSDAGGRDYSFSVDTMQIPDSTIYVNVDGPFAVQGGYEVSEDNPYLASTEDGVLTSKDGTEYLGVPVTLDALDVPAGVESVEVPAANSLSEIRIHSAGGVVPTINAENLTDCRIVVDDDLFDAFTEQNFDELENTFGVEVARASNPSETFVCSGGMVFSEDALDRVLNSGTSTAFVQIPHTIKAGAFEGCTDVETIVLFGDGAFVFEDGSLTGGSVKDIVCFSQAQVDYVQGRLAAAGAPDARAVLAGADDSGEFLYYRDDANKLVLLSYQGWGIESFDGTLQVGDKTMPVDTIAARAFSGVDTLKWVDLDERTTEIGASAFNGCSALEGFYMGAEGTTHIGKDAFVGCTNLGFWASSSLDAQFDSQENPNPDCRWYCPATYLTDEEGNGNWYYPSGYDPAATGGRFNCIGGVEYLDVAAQEDGTLVLYGVDDEDTPWVALASGFSYEGELEIPGTVVEIFDSAFLELQGPFTLKWEPEQDAYIDANAFKNSGLTGQIEFGSDWWNLQIGDGAFRGCADITSFTASGYKLSINDYILADCPSLTSVTLDTQIGGSLGTEAFSGSDALTDLYFPGKTPLSLTLFSPGTPYRFNGMLTEGEEAEGLRIHVPEGSEQAYLEAWVYPMVGQLSYWDMYSTVQWALYEENGYESLPSEREVRARMGEELLAPENRLRKMMGLEAVDASTIVVDNYIETEDGYTFKIEDDGSLTLTAIPEDATVVDIDAIVPEGYDSVTIGANAFENGMWVSHVVLGSKTTAIENGAFLGTFFTSVELPSDHVPTLKGGSQYSGFDFGNDYLTLEFTVDAGLTGEEREAAIEAAQKRYLEAWPRQCMGLTSDDLVGFYIDDCYWTAAWNALDGGIGPSDEGWNDYFDHLVNDPLLQHENYLRGLMGLDSISGLDELAYRCDISQYKNELGGSESGSGAGTGSDGEDDIWGDPDAGGSGNDSGSESGSGSDDGDDLEEIPDPGNGSGSDSGDDLTETDAPGANGGSGTSGADIEA